MKFRFINECSRVSFRRGGACKDLAGFREGRRRLFRGSVFLRRICLFLRSFFYVTFIEGLIVF